jgi:hypothetical protein
MVETHSGIVLCGLLIAVFYPLTRHTTHFFGVRPLPSAACVPADASLHA